MKAQFLMDTYGKKVGVILSVKEYTRMLEELEELDAIRAYDKAKKNDDGKRILFSNYLKKRNGGNAKVYRQLI